MPHNTVFQTRDLGARELQRADLPALQAFLEANPEYFLTVAGQPPRPDEALQEFEDRPPPHLPYGSYRVLGLQDDAGSLQGVIVLLSDFVQPAVWHIGLFIVATARHGRGDAAATCLALEDWMRSRGARWSRLSVVDVNPRALRFWSRMGYAEVRRREGVVVGERTMGARVMVKPLAGATVAQYLDLVERDRPDSALP